MTVENEFIYGRCLNPINLNISKNECVIMQQPTEVMMIAQR